MGAMPATMIPGHCCGATSLSPRPHPAASCSSRALRGRAAQGARQGIPRRSDVPSLAAALPVAIGTWARRSSSLRAGHRRQQPSGLRSSFEGGEALCPSLVEQLPEEVEGYKVMPVCVSPRPPLPGDRPAICCLVVSDVEEEDHVDLILWNPPAGTAAQQAISAMRDAFGVLGVWPAAWVAAERVLTLCRRRPRPLRVLEIGCGSGLPSLCALASGAEVVATDLEELPLKLLQAAAEAQELPGQLEIQEMDVLAAAGGTRSVGGLARKADVVCPSDVEAFDVIVCSDCLYKSEVAIAIAQLLGRALLKRPGTSLVVTDANRRGRQDFLDTLDECLGLSLGDATPPSFEAVAVPDWAADDARDPFDGTSTYEVGLLKLY